jgi:hypothetical protein
MPHFHIEIAVDTHAAGTAAIRLQHKLNNLLVQRPEIADVFLEEDVCPECEGYGYTYEGGMSFNPEVDNKVPCSRGCEE